MALLTPSRTRLAVVVLLAVLVVGALPAPVVAQSGGQIGGTVTVAEDETVSDVQAVAGTVVVEGTVTGDVNAVAGDVRIEGDVGGDVSAAAGNVELADGATVGGDVSVGAGNVVVDGTIESDASIGAETITLGEDAAIAGDLRYGGNLAGNTDAVAGTITEDSTLAFGLGPTIQPITSWLASVYVLALNLLLGAALLALFPRFSDGVADRVATDPARSGLVGLGVLVAVPILLVATAITVIGIPLSIVGAFAFALLVWIGIVYGRFAVAAWLLGAVDVENRWLALVVGMGGGAALAAIPFVGGLLNLVILLLGLGALAVGVYTHRRSARERDRERRGPIGPDEPASD